MKRTNFIKATLILDLARGIYKATFVGNITYLTSF